MHYELFFLMAMFLGIFWIMHRRKRSAVKAERAAMFNRCISLFDNYKIIQDGIYYPVLYGCYKGYDFKLEPIADHIAFRTLPSLWLLVTLKGRVPYEGVFDFMVRHKNVEFFSPISRLKIDIDIPERWPGHALLRTNFPEQMPPQEQIEPHMDFFDDPKAKEFLITPNGVRLVYQARQADRAYYMVLRQVVFEDTDISPNLVKGLMDRAVSVYRDFTKENQDIGKKNNLEAA
jgi:hypothetical protein